jgi:hypothetical protein
LIAALTRGVYAHGAEYFKLMIIGDGRAQHIPQCRSDNTQPEFAGRCCGGTAAGSGTHLGEPHGVQAYAAEHS